MKVWQVQKPCVLGPVCKIFLQDFFLAHWKRERLISKQLGERWEQQQQQTCTLLQGPVDSELHILTYNNNVEIGTQQKKILVENKMLEIQLTE
jgi:hypothetical protein